MTIEVERTDSRFFGMQKTFHTRVLDFRAWTKRISESMTSGFSGDMLVLSIGPILEDDEPSSKFVFATPISEDDLEVTTKSNLMERGESVIYSKDRINRENLTSHWGERIVWKETQPGDYPPLEPGQELRPIQQGLKLV